MRYFKQVNVIGVCLLILLFSGCSLRFSGDNPSDIITGAEQTEQYFSYLKGKRVGVLINPTSVIKNTSLVDTLVNSGIKVVKIFGPEHGFRGDASAGVSVNDTVDDKTGIPVISLYGKRSKPSKDDMEGIEIMIFDIQDVGVRFYTYINVLKYMMEACAANNTELLILDRPNPNGFYVDGPVLDMKLRSGIGMFPIPIVHGMTIAEFAQMINGEGWLTGKVKCKLRIVELKKYSHSTPYDLPVPPSPNLNTQQAIMLYPSLCLFEGTVISQGRGTYFPFTVLGSPLLKNQYKFSFKPVSIKGMSETPLYQNQICYGLDLRRYNVNKFRRTKQLNLKWLMEMYKAYPDKEKFFDQTQSSQIGNFDKLAGTSLLREQIIAGKTEAEIRKSWEPGLIQFKKIREKYLMYD